MRDVDDRVQLQRERRACVGHASLRDLVDALSDLRSVVGAKGRAKDAPAVVSV
ncbi:MAG: hypothetical protein R3F49_24510 [Planctomycetota bacterium]